MRGLCQFYKVVEEESKFRIFGYEFCQFKVVMDEDNGSLRMLLIFCLINNNIRWQIRSGSLHLPPAVLTPGMIGHFEDSVHEICENLEIINSCVGLKDVFYQNFPKRLQQIKKLSKEF